MSARVSFEGREVAVAPGQTLLEALLSAGISLPNACRSGVCQSCCLQLLEGEPPLRSQQGLAPVQREAGHLLACQARPSSDIAVRRLDGRGDPQRCEVIAVDELAASIFRIRATRPAGFDYRPGQYVTLWRGARTCRAYSLAGREDDDFLEFHVRRYEPSEVSSWLCTLAAGDAFSIEGPYGQCIYTGCDPSQPLLLAGTGVGLAPLWGILGSAVGRRHEGPIHVLHGVRDAAGGYLDADLRDLASRHGNLHYKLVPDGARQLVLETLSLQPSFHGWKAFLCGGPEFVRALRKHLFLAGAASRDILADEFCPLGS